MLLQRARSGFVTIGTKANSPVCRPWGGQFSRGESAALFVLAMVGEFFSIFAKTLRYSSCWLRLLGKVNAKMLLHQFRRCWRTRCCCRLADCSNVIQHAISA